MHKSNRRIYMIIFSNVWQRHEDQSEKQLYKHLYYILIDYDFFLIDCDIDEIKMS